MTSHRPALVGIAAAVLLLAGCAAFGGGGGASSPTPPGPPEVSVLDLSVGDCLDTHGKPRISDTVTVVDCSLEHDSEAYASITVEGDTFPGDDAATSQAQQGCVDAFTTFMGIAYDASSLDYVYYYPTAGSWAAGDRRILCLVIDPQAGQAEGTLRGAAR